MMCGILVPQPGIEPVHPTLKVQDLERWTTREVLTNYILLFEAVF